jgi:hypothetical protein
LIVAGGGDLSGTAYFQPFRDLSRTAGKELASQESVSVSGSSPQNPYATSIVTFDTAEARRSLMRHLAGVVYRAMVADARARQDHPLTDAA